MISLSECLKPEEQWASTIFDTTSFKNPSLRFSHSTLQYSKKFNRVKPGDPTTTQPTFEYASFPLNSTSNFLRTSWKNLFYFFSCLLSFLTVLLATLFVILPFETVLCCEIMKIFAMPSSMVIAMICPASSSFLICCSLCTCIESNSFLTRVIAMGGPMCMACC